MPKKRLPLLDSVKSDVISLFQNLEKLHTMKKNITINLFGTLYAIDEDACQLLETYLNNMKNYFSRRDGGDEIADDIEHRVAELFSELREKGVEAVTIEHVRDIISRIGNPEQMDNETDDSPADASAPESEGTSANADAAADNATVRKNKKPCDYCRFASICGNGGKVFTDVAKAEKAADDAKKANKKAAKKTKEEK